MNRHETVELPDDSAESVRAAFEVRGWGDGLPVVAPTVARVDAMLAPDGGDPDEVIAMLPPRQGHATRRTIAVNAVMAGRAHRSIPALTRARNEMPRSRPLSLPVGR